jgi:hypothetical protein
MSARGNSLSSSSFVSIVCIMAALAWMSALSPATAPAASAPETPPEMVATYETLATVILGAKDTEANLVRSILAATNAHAEVELGRAKKAITANDTKAAQAAVENLAADVGQLATEGDNAVAGIRKRLLEGGHHHNAAGEAQGIFDEGYVIVTKAAKKSFLESSKAFAGMAASAKADALDAEWKKVQATYSELMSKK